MSFVACELSLIAWGYFTKIANKQESYPFFQWKYPRASVWKTFCKSPLVHNSATHHFGFSRFSGKLAPPGGLSRRRHFHSGVGGGASRRPKNGRELTLGGVVSVWRGGDYVARLMWRQNADDHFFASSTWDFSLIVSFIKAHCSSSGNIRFKAFSQRPLRCNFAPVLIWFNSCLQVGVVITISQG